MAGGVGHQGGSMNVVEILRATAAEPHRLDFCRKAVHNRLQLSESSPEGPAAPGVNGFTCDVVKDSRMETVIINISK